MSEDQHFNLVEWYRQHLDQAPERGIFEYQYREFNARDQLISERGDLDIEFEYHTQDSEEAANADNLPELTPLSDAGAEETGGDASNPEQLDNDSDGVPELIPMSEDEAEDSEEEEDESTEADDPVYSDPDQSDDEWRLEEYSAVIMGDNLVDRVIQVSAVPGGWLACGPYL